MGSNRWKIRITRLDADSYRNFMSRNPYDVMATLVGRAEMALEFDVRGQRIRHVYSGFFTTKVSIKNYWDRVGIIRMRTILVIRIARFVLRLEPRNPTSVEPPDEAFAEGSIDRAVHESLQSYLTEHYAGRDLLVLLPRFDLKRWLKQQRDKGTKLGWLTDILNHKSDEDEADWWKRGDDPPY